MKRFFILVITSSISLLAHTQVKNSPKKYPSLFWEITGNGITKPSYLFGTMHVSSKIAFHLSDSFYVAIKNVDIVALETNPETWQEDMNNSDINGIGNNYARNQLFSFVDMPHEYFNIRNLRIPKYEERAEIAMFSKPSMINNLLYRSLSDYSSDFEEDTYLDLYIYQTGKKLGKKVAGVENYEESMRLMNEAFLDAAKEKDKKERSFGYDDDYSPSKLQEAYRAGNLDLLDSINRLNSQSDAFDEKFLYRRNEIQANSIDSIIRKNRLFVGVGAAHLPGSRGVIELLRRKGYKLRPIYMNSRDGKQKDEVEKVRVPVIFSTQSAEDGFYQVDIPGKFYRFSNTRIFDQQQYADMANGSFYMVTRLKTNSLFWGHSGDIVAKKIDSMLYENVPGKILTKTTITKNGYRGFDITSRTRRGDINRYNIFITPFEIVFFKMGGNGDYVKNGDEAKKFFGSIQLKEFKNEGWNSFSPAFGGFSVEFPQSPYESFGENIQFDAFDQKNNQHFTVIRSDIHNYNFAEEDTFDLRLMDESFSSSEFIEKNISRKQIAYKGYPALDCKYKHKNGSLIYARFLLQGPHYYTLLAHVNNDNSIAEKFLNSFHIIPLIYNETSEHSDSSMYYSVKTSWYPVEKKSKLELPDEETYASDDDDDSDFSFFDKDDYKTKIIKNDTTGETIFIRFSRLPRYTYIDSMEALKYQKYRSIPGFDTTWLVLRSKTGKTANGMNYEEKVVSDTNSSRCIRVKTFFNTGISFQLMTETDTLTPPSSFVQTFFENFEPVDTFSFNNPYTRKSKIFFADLFGDDTIARKKAIGSISSIELDSTDLPMLIKAINSFKWSEKKYLERKIAFINKLGKMPLTASTDFLKKLYFEAGDTVKLQYAALETMLKQRTQYAYNVFRDIITNEPPVLETSNSYSLNYQSYYSVGTAGSGYSNSFSNNSFLDELYDSLKLTRTIFIDILPLMNLDDYEKPIMRLLETMIDSGLVKPKDYETYYSKFYLEAKQEFKKQAISEKKSAIEKAEEEKQERKSYNMYSNDRQDKGNDELVSYATLLLPFRKTNPPAQELIYKMLISDDKRLRYDIMYLLLKNDLPVADSVISYYAGEDEYRYELYSDLKELKLLSKFPKKYNNVLDISRSKLYVSNYYSKPDSLVYIDSLGAITKNATGTILFYRYKSKKDDAFWKLATVGLLKREKNVIGFSDEEDDEEQDYDFTSISAVSWNNSYNNNRSDFTEYTDEKVGVDMPVKLQLEKQLRKLVYSKRKSARRFYYERPDMTNASRRFLD